jgi:hypothetical protein
MTLRKSGLGLLVCALFAFSVRAEDEAKLVLRDHFALNPATAGIQFSEKFFLSNKDTKLQKGHYYPVRSIIASRYELPDKKEITKTEYEYQDPASGDWIVISEEYVEEMRMTLATSEAVPEPKKVTKSKRASKPKKKH